MDDLKTYLDARRIVGTLDTEAPPTEPMASPMPLDETDEYEPTIVACQGIPPCNDDPCEICVAGDLETKPASTIDLTSLAWVFVRNEADNAVEVSLAYWSGYAYRRKVNLRTGRATYARANRMNATEAGWLAVDEHSGQLLVGFVP